MNRRSILAALGTAAAGSGVVFGSGAFTQLEADRSVSIGVTADDDSSTQVQLNPIADEVNANGNELQIDASGVNVNSTVEFGSTDFKDASPVIDDGDEAFEVINNSGGTLSFQFSLDELSDGSDEVTFAFDGPSDSTTVSPGTSGFTVGDSGNFDSISDTDQISVAVQAKTDSDTDNIDLTLTVTATQ
jgi:hypothetical protein